MLDLDVFFQVVQFLPQGHALLGVGQAVFQNVRHIPHHSADAPVIVELAGLHIQRLQCVVQKVRVDLQLQRRQLGILLAVLLFLELDIQVGIVQKHHQDVVHDDIVLIVHLAARPLNGVAGLGILKHLEHEVDFIKAAPGVRIGEEDDGRQHNDRHHQQRGQPLTQTLQDHAAVNRCHDVKVRRAVGLPAQQAVPPAQLSPCLALAALRNAARHDRLHIVCGIGAAGGSQQAALAVHQIHRLVLILLQGREHPLQMLHIQPDCHTALHRHHPAAYHQLAALTGHALVHNERRDADALLLGHLAVDAVPAVIVISRQVGQPCGGQRPVKAVHIDQHRLHIVVGARHAVERGHNIAQIDCIRVGQRLPPQRLLHDHIRAGHAGQVGVLGHNAVQHQRDIGLHGVNVAGVALAHAAHLGCKCHVGRHCHKQQRRDQHDHDKAPHSF